MKRPKICAVITENNFDLVAGVDRFVDLYEVRMDLTGDGWQEWVKRLRRPWIACSRLREEGGNWRGDEASRVGKLFEAIEFGARIVDIELRTPDLAHIAAEIKKDKAECLISVHNLVETPDICELKGIIREQNAAGAGICKVVTTAQRFEDNFTVLRLFHECPETRLVAFAIGQVGVVSRVLSAMSGGYFTYASITEGTASAPGQLTAAYLRSLYEAVRNNQNNTTNTTNIKYYQ
jgi:3-dehydroquinate dehydratase-1